MILQLVCLSSEQKNIKFFQTELLSDSARNSLVMEFCSFKIM